MVPHEPGEIARGRLDTGTTVAAPQEMTPGTNRTEPGVAVATSPPALPLVLAGLWAVEFCVLGWAPRDRSAWILENLIAVPVVVGLVWGRRRIPFSSAAWVLTFSFLALHEVGSHFTYSHVPWMQWSRDLLGSAPDWDRNHYDRALHFAFGLLLTLPVRELLSAGLTGNVWVLRFLAICVICALSGVYELLEWGAAAWVDPDIGIAFVGAQGDIWDAQKDMALALAGSVLAMKLDWIWAAVRRSR